MARQPRQAAIDAICREWGRTRRQLTWGDQPRTAREQIGPLRSTLGQRRDLHHGARSNRLDQHWPEVYVDDAFVVNQAFKRMAPPMALLMEIHYAAPWALDEKYDFMCMSRAKYHDQVQTIRTFIEGWLAREKVA